MDWRRTITIAVVSFVASGFATYMLMKPAAAFEPPAGAARSVVSAVPLSPGDKLLLLESAGQFQMSGARPLPSWSVMRVRGDVTELFEIGVVGEALAPGKQLKVGDRKTPVGRNHRGENLTHHNVIVEERESSVAE